MKCNACGRQYNDPGDIAYAKKTYQQWADLCRADGVEPTGLIGCPNITCPGELVLLES